MKFVLRIAGLALIILASVLLWQKFCPPARPTPAPKPTAPDLSLRTWIDKNGRSFQGCLISAKDDHVIVRREGDAACFKLSAAVLTAEDQSYLQQQICRAKTYDGGFPDQIAGLYALGRKLDIKGDLVRVSDRTSPGGWRTDRIDPIYWFLLSARLYDTDSGSIWVRVDEKTFNAHNEGALITQDHMLNASDGKGGFSESLPWSRPHTTISEARYGANAHWINVTDKLLHLAAQGRLPVEIQPEMFQLPPHSPASWELTVAWRTATGDIRRTLRDGSILTWP